MRPMQVQSRAAVKGCCLRPCGFRALRTRASISAAFSSLRRWSQLLHDVRQHWATISRVFTVGSSP